MILDECHRPWGKWEVLEVDQGYKVKRLTVDYGKSLSKQYHNHRSETWCVVQGTGEIEVDGVKSTITVGDTIVIPIRAVHKVTGMSKTAPLVVIETQMGEQCVEEDIVRLD